jgi:hypothetical protein
MLDSPLHPAASFWLDVFDKAIKLGAVFIGGLWTFWNYRKSRTYEQKLELEVVGTVFARGSLYGDVKCVVRNIGAAQHTVQQEGTFCELSVVRKDLSEDSIELFRVFLMNDKIEPGEAINDIQYWKIAPPIANILWVKLTLRVVSNGVEWFSTCLVRVEREEPEPTLEVV